MKLKVKRCWGVLALVVGAAIASPPPLDAVVISEIHYNPAPGNDALEFIEITNDHDSPEDISGWAFVDGIFFTFPPGTILRGREALAVCANVDAVRSFYGIETAVGNYEGRLDGSGERITLVNHVAQEVESLRYRDRGKWPVAADGMGHSLVLKTLHSDTSEPESWTRSPELGGSPGLGNFPRDRALFTEATIVDEGTEWRFARGRGPFSAVPLDWTLPGFDDTTWEIGPAGFGFGDEDDSTVLDDMQGLYTSVAIRLRLELTEEQIDDRSVVILQIAFDDGFCAYINGTAFAAERCPDEVIWSSRSVGAHEARPGQDSRFEIPRTLLQAGENVVAIVGYNRTLIDNDFTLLPRFVSRRFSEEKMFTEPALRFNELRRGATTGDGWVELYNTTGAARDISGWKLTDDPDSGNAAEFPEGTMVAPYGFIVVDEATSSLALSVEVVRLWLVRPDGIVSTARVFDREVPDGFEPGQCSEALFPDGADFHLGQGDRWITPTPTPGSRNEVPRTTDVVINEIYYHPPEEREGEFLELYNRGEQPVDLSGFRFSSGIDFTFAPGTSIDPGEFLVLAEDPLLLSEHYGFHEALRYDGSLSDGGENIRLVDAAGNLVDEVRYHDGGQWSLWADGLGASLELVDPRQDNDFAQSWAPSDESNKSTWQEHSYTVQQYDGGASEFKLIFASRGICHLDDLSIRQQRFTQTPLVETGEQWRFRRGVKPFSIPDTAWQEPDFDDSGWETGATPIGFGEDGVVTFLRDMEGNYPTVAMRKRFQISEAALDSSDSFTLGVRFDDGFCAFINGVKFVSEACPEPPAWDATATSLHSAGHEEVFPIPKELLRPGENTLAIIGFNRRVDNSDFFLSARIAQRTPAGLGDNFIPNPGFEADTELWTMQGTHGRSRRITENANSGSACLELVATGKGNTRCNNLEIDTDPRMVTGEEYHVSLWARWIRGSSLLIPHGDFSRGDFPGTRDTNLSANPLSTTFRLTVPWNLGTPGSPNSTLTGSGNLGPLIGDVRHLPVSPPPATAVRVQARVADGDGIRSVTAFFKEDGAEEEYQSVELGATASADALADATLASLYTGEIPALPAEVKQVSYFIESVDSAGVARRFPPEAPEQTLVYRADGPLEEAFHLIISERGQEALSSQSIHSNDLVDATVIYDNEQTFYNVGARYRGSPWGRGQRQSYRLRFGEDQMFKGKLSEVNFGQRDAQSDGPAYFFYRRSGTAENPAPASDYHYVRGRRDGGPAAMYGLFEPVNRNFVRRWFGPEAADDAVVLKADGRMRYSDSCDFIDWDEVVLYHRDEDPENYRFYWFHALNRSRDNWQPFIDGTRVLSPRTTPDEEFDRGFESVVDLDAWMRVYMARVLMNDGDGLFLGNGHNGYVLWDPTDGRFHYLPFDMGGALGGQPATLRLVRDKVVQRFMNHPRALRLYYRLIHEFSQGYWSPDIAGPYLEALEEDFPGPGKRALDFVRVSSNNLPDKLEPFVSPQLRILTNDGEDFTTDLPRVQLEGEVSVVAPTLRMRQNGGPMQPFEPVWTSATDWTLELSLSGEENLIEIFALDADGAPIDFTSMTIGRGPLRSFLRGDVNGDQALNIADPVATLNSLFQGGLLTCEDAADFDDSGRVEITDAIASLDFSFRDGSPPPAPFPTPGEDPTDDSLECRG